MTIQLLINNEDYLFLRHFKRIEKKLVDESMRDFNYQRLSAKDVSGTQLVDQLNMLPMMSDSRVIVVEDLESFSKQDESALQAYFEKPSETTHLIMLCHKMDKRTALYKAIKKTGDVIEFKPLYPNQVPQFVAEEAQNMGLSLDSGCADRLADIVGTNLMSIVSELEKLSLYVWPEKRVTLKHVSELVSLGLVENIFKITDHIARRDYHQAMSLYAKMNEQGEAVIKIMALVVSHFRKLMMVKSAGPRGQNPQDLSRLLGVNPFFIKTYLQQARQFNEAQLKQVYSRLMKTSMDLRRMPVSGATLFETFLQDTCVSGARRKA